MKIIISIALFFLLGTFVYSKPMNIGFTVGLALPNDNVSQFYNQVAAYIKTDSATTKPGRYILDKATSIGYTLSVKGRIELAERFDLALGIGIARFNQGQYDFIISNDTLSAKIQSTSNIVPVSVGMNAYIVKSFINLYVMGDVSYNYISYSYDIVWNKKPSIPVTNIENNSRLGYGFGFGIDFDLNLFKINLETKFNTANIIGRSGDEQQKNYGTITLGIIF